MPNFVDVTNDAVSSRVLRGSQVRREPFNPTDREHLTSLQHYLETGNWGDVQFFAEYPQVSVPETVLRKFAKAAIEADFARTHLTKKVRASSGALGRCDPS